MKDRPRPVKQHATADQAEPVTEEPVPLPTTLVFLPVPATGEDCLCSCLICHLPRRDYDGVERGDPVEWVVRMRLVDCTIWQGLHTACWERNQKPIPFGCPAESRVVETDATFLANREPGGTEP
jgi:hypothetical protein